MTDSAVTPETLAAHELRDVHRHLSGATAEGACVAVSSRDSRAMSRSTEQRVADIMEAITRCRRYIGLIGRADEAELIDMADAIEGLVTA